MDKQVQKNQDSKKVSMGPKGQPSKTIKRKREKPERFPPTTEPCSGSGLLYTWTCRNASCKAELSVADTFCKRCTCCICYHYDENKDPSLWLECASDSTSSSCGSSCHIECALLQRKVGAVDLGQGMQLDGSYCCAKCGNVSGILG
ncbi:hypothetical protein M8C21_027769 [Ambrosia artemisiifolia]|uniref:Oberon-like PHD finger domain-containing protein n=1 Tax=Ambrosia artemisiifolia TaxID=4212 RepID=A0AAD5GFM2_AMBAR|nr:hypothetical protein M8C21_027769 [Ambrosia artemisiifolia]